MAVRRYSVPPQAAIEALADAWASIDGKVRAFRAGKGKPLAKQPGGHYLGYICDAEELARRLAARGFVLRALRAAAGKPIV